MAKTAKKEGLDDITDIEIVDYARHPRRDHEAVAVTPSLASVPTPTTDF